MVRSANTVLVPLDGSIQATVALPVARGLGQLLHATVAVLHVTDDTLAARALIERVKLAREDASGLVIERCPGAAAAAAIVRTVGDRHAALIVMCPWTRAERQPRTLGSVGEAVLRSAPCPIVLVPPSHARKSWSLRRLLVPHDGTPTSAAVIGPAADLAAAARAELVVLHVATPGTARPVEPGTLVSPRYVDQPQHEWPEWAREFLSRLCAAGGARLTVETRLAVAHGDAGSAIVDYARHSDLVVLGWRGVLTPDRARTLRCVIRDTSCPVAVMRLGHDDGR